LITLRGTSDSDETFVAALLGFVDLDDAATQVTYFVNLSTTLSDDGTDHVVGNINLLSQWLARHGAAYRSRGSWGTTSRGGLLRSANIGSGLMGSCATVGSLGCGGEVHGSLGNRSRSRLAVKVGNTVRTATGAVGVGVVTLESIGMAVLTAGRLGNVRDDLHAARDSTCRTAAASSVGRGRGTAVTLGQLLNQGGSNVIGGNVNGICDTKDDEGALCGQRKACIGSIQASTGGLLDFTNATATLSDDGTNQDVGN
jgi:hypothetical protein